MKSIQTVKMYKKCLVSKFNNYFRIYWPKNWWLLVGNKVNEPAAPAIIEISEQVLTNPLRVVSEVEARNFATSIGIRYLETSAKENLNVEQVFISPNLYKF